MPKLHTVSLDDFDGFVGKTLLASESTKSKRLQLIAMPRLNAFYYSVWAEGEQEQQFTLAEFEKAIEAYNDL